MQQQGFLLKTMNLIQNPTILLQRFPLVPVFSYENTHWVKCNKIIREFFAQKLPWKLLSVWGMAFLETVLMEPSFVCSYLNDAALKTCVLVSSIAQLPASILHPQQTHYKLLLIFINNDI